jgi:hypothetical protein
MGMKRLDFKWCFIRRMKRGGGENGQRMQRGARVIDSMAGEAEAALEGDGSRWQGHSSVLGRRRKKALGWAEQADWAGN